MPKSSPAVRVPRILTIVIAFGAAMAWPCGGLIAQEQDAAEEHSAATDTVAQREGKPVEVIVTASGGPRRAIEVPQATTTLDEREIVERLPQTVPDALDEVPGVVIQKTNQGGGSPVIRGRTGNSVLLLLDGIRFNNSTFRRNNQYLNTIDLAAVERFEIARGPASVLYGSDAMAGAVNVITRRFELGGPTRLGGRLSTQFSSADKGIVSHLSVEGGSRDFGVIAGITYKDFDDLRAGNHGPNPTGAVDTSGRQVPTGYTEIDGSLSAIWQLGDYDTVDFLYLHSRQDDVPRSDRLIPNDEQPIAPDLRRDTAPQILRWYQARYQYDNPGELIERFEVSAVLQNPEEARRRIRTDDPGRQTNEYDEIVAPGLSARLSLRVAPDHLMTTGVEGYYEQVRSDRVDIDRATGVRTPRPGRYPDGSVYQSYGIFAQDEWEIDDDWTWSNGIRYSVFRVRVDFEDLTVGPIGPFGRESETFDDVTFATGLSHRVADGTWVYGSIARGFRAPNLGDLATLGDFSSGERVPNLDLEPESVWSFEIGAKHEESAWRGGAACAVAYYDDLLGTERAFTLDGQDFFQVANRGRAVVYSFESAGEVVVVPSDGDTAEHVVFGHVFADIGRATTENEPLTKVPPPQGEIGYRIEDAAGSWFGEVYARGALEQDRLAQADLDDPRIPNDGTPAWATFNVRGGIELGADVSLTAALENLFDRRYRVHGSGVDAPGFNAIVQLDWRF